MKYTQLYSDGFVKRGQYWGWLVCTEDGNVVAHHIVKTKTTPQAYLAEMYGMSKAIKLLNPAGMLLTDCKWMKTKVVSSVIMHRSKFSRTQGRQFQTLFKNVVDTARHKGIFIQWIKRDQNKAGVMFDRIKERVYEKINKKKNGVKVPVQFQESEFDIPIRKLDFFSRCYYRFTALYQRIKFGTLGLIRF